MGSKELTRADITKLIFLVESYASGDKALVDKLKNCESVIEWRDSKHTSKAK
jgi:hypothetical protein